MSESEHRRDLTVRALKLATPNLREIAEEAGLNYATLRAYSVGHRTPDVERLSALSSVLRRRALELLDLSAQIDATVRSSR